MRLGQRRACDDLLLPTVRLGWGRGVVVSKTRPMPLARASQLGIQAWASASAGLLTMTMSDCCSRCSDRIGMQLINAPTG